MADPILDFGDGSRKDCYLEPFGTGLYSEGNLEFSKRGKQISKHSAGFLEKLPDDPEEEDDYGYTTQKVKRKYPDHHNVQIVRIHRQNARGRVGVYLCRGEGKDAKRRSFVCGVDDEVLFGENKDKLLYADELLETNGIILHGLLPQVTQFRMSCLVNNVLTLVIDRNPDNENIMVVKKADKKFMNKYANINEDVLEIDFEKTDELIAKVKELDDKEVTPEEKEFMLQASNRIRNDESNNRRMMYSRMLTECLRGILSSEST